MFAGRPRFVPKHRHGRQVITWPTGGGGEPTCRSVVPHRDDRTHKSNQSNQSRGLANRIATSQRRWPWWDVGRR
ncbi:hypothetical protein RB2031 [Rhodopirellula baltica SH 1]|uniref:Uncharacterized protein n=1 Tax=Rhodopirellula baltica (strain DSM 10527 / NCIMB 13988 / SH1) TaxID=243090 RepID=Q7UWH5_RHOBA|nr:hypothetical protein RB2031 [Rhodopirellula baltica SH 1]